VGGLDVYHRGLENNRPGEGENEWDNSKQGTSSKRTSHVPHPVSKTEYWEGVNENGGGLVERGGKSRIDVRGVHGQSTLTALY